MKQRTVGSRHIRVVVLEEHALEEKPWRCIQHHLAKLDTSDYAKRIGEVEHSVQRGGNNYAVKKLTVQPFFPSAFCPLALSSHFIESLR